MSHLWAAVRVWRCDGVTRRRRANEEQGAFTEQLVADRYDLEHRPDEADWYDCVNPRTGTKYEVKSTHETLASGASGRFRLWEDQHRSLTVSDGQVTAWYVFVLLSETGEVVEVRRMKPSTVTEIVDGEWNQAGHRKRKSRQHKLHFGKLF
ncbi:hypothetical protein [Salinigranum rubrum]|uniref:hypothetical protein n=1 Tax=Salinigranum rubrum TaxID=755307 RepID=UPI0013A58074|nr:hypothetical protein [Salinigranum rubrum]